MYITIEIINMLSSIQHNYQKRVTAGFKSLKVNVDSFINRTGGKLTAYSRGCLTGTINDDAFQKINKELDEKELDAVVSYRKGTRDLPYFNEMHINLSKQPKKAGTVSKHLTTLKKRFSPSDLLDTDKYAPFPIKRDMVIKYARQLLEDNGFLEKTKAV